jgi:NADH:ubiquinone oxidoreductase subunit D
MNVTYTFSSLQSLADYFENAALREDNTAPRTKKAALIHKEAAATWRAAAAVVRASTITGLERADG